MIDALVSGLVALLTAALLYIGAHDWGGLPDEIIIDDALACGLAGCWAGVQVVA
jgi:hypothetical protein